MLNAECRDVSVPQITSHWHDVKKNFPLHAASDEFE